MIATVEPMAKKRKVGRPKGRTRREPVVGLKAVPEWKAWFDDFAEFCGLSGADTIGMALEFYANHKGFQPPPKR